ncbi:hypothetical protein KVR01_001764 [Diaporthe batatas]|uniref:uncharacterized protein n=1 Tax=Diaporthe batatas TaxID=748121 RepID=UPI001D046DE1|nr:uncharacterized protein KVR01_001764 [Diaporthe batatas]KAG8169015.1 hypothetical protein KVR01_001764 [Diaporthe batatas]
MKAVVVVAVGAGLVAAQVNYTNGHYECALPHQVYCLGESLATNVIVRCDESAIGQVGNCNDTSNITGDAACSKNCVVYGSSGNANGTFTLPAEVCTPTYTATPSLATISSTSTQSLTVSPSSDSDSTQTDISTVTTTVCTESESSTTSAGIVTDPSPPSLTTSTTSATDTTTIIPPTFSTSSEGGGTTPTAGSTVSEPSSGGPGSVVTSTSSVAAVSTTSFPTAGAVANHVGVGLGVMGLLVGAIL